MLLAVVKTQLVADAVSVLTDRAVLELNLLLERRVADWTRRVGDQAVE